MILNLNNVKTVDNTVKLNNQYRECEHIISKVVNITRSDVFDFVPQIKSRHIYKNTSDMQSVGFVCPQMLIFNITRK